MRARKIQRIRPSGCSSLDISGSAPVQKQALPVTNSYSGIAFNPNGEEFYVSGGNADNVHIFDRKSGEWAETAAPVALGHLAKASRRQGNYGGLGIEIDPEAAGVAVTCGWQTLVVANYENDSISVLKSDGSRWKLQSELDLRPGVIDPKNETGSPGGEFPFWVQIKANDVAYVSSVRDREIDVVSLNGASSSMVKRIKLKGQPNKSVLNKAQTLLYVAQDNSDSVAVIDTARNAVIDDIKVTAPEKYYANAQHYRGANPNSVTLSPDEKTLYVTNGGENAVAVVTLAQQPAPKSYVRGLIPTGFYPNSLSTSADGKMLYVVNGKSAEGPNPRNCHPLNSEEQKSCRASNQYIYELTKAGFQTLPVPEETELGELTRTVVDDNDHFRFAMTPEQKQTVAELRSKIKHVIYIIKENRTYDQVLGDLPVGNGDPSITQFPQKMTPNFHELASNFVDFDNFYCASEVSGDGWPWSTSARTTDVVEKEIPVNYGGRGVSYDSEGTNRNINVAYGNQAERERANPLGGKDLNLLPGTRDVAAPDSDDGDEEQGYLWDAALKAGLRVRSYGFFLDLERYNLSGASAKYNIPEDTNPFAHNLQVAYSTSVSLRGMTDKYFRGFDNSFPDLFRVMEWQREFRQFERQGRLPNLELVRVMHDHFGEYKTAIKGVNTPELQIADNDYAVGLIVETVAKSRFKDDTLIFVIEDDAQDGGDHVDAHRSTAFIVGPYVKHGYVDSTRYNTVSMLRTIEDILGIPHLNLNDASTQPMLDAFDMNQKDWTYTAVPSAYSKQTLAADSTGEVSGCHQQPSATP